MYYSFSMAICMRYCSIHEDALEIMNDGFVKIFRQIESFTPRYNDYELSLKGWMKKIFIHTSIDHYRKNIKYTGALEVSEDHLHETGSSSAIDNMSYKEIMQLIQKLSPAYRTVFNLYVIDGFKHEEIAESLKISVGTSKSNLSKARLIIQKMLLEANTLTYERAV